MSFKDRPFNQRFAALGDQAERVFEETYGEGWVRYGLNRPPINLARVPSYLRYTPDYMTAKGLVEVQGFGKDQTFKLKHEKAEALDEWAYIDRDWPLFFFVYDSHHKQYAWVEYPTLMGYVARATTLTFPEGKKYYAWNKHDLPTDDGWVPYEVT